MEGTFETLASALFRLVRRAHAFVPAHLSREGYALPPWHYYLEPTRRCNLRCQMCGYLDWWAETPLAKQRDGELTTEEWARVIGDVGRFCLITFTGGEVFLRSDFPELLERASRRCLASFISNGLLIDQERARHCIDVAPRRLGSSGLYFIGISVDGPGAVHDHIRRVKQGYATSMHAISALAEARRGTGKPYPKIFVTSVMQKDNLDSLPQMPALVKAAGADIYNLNLEMQNLRYVDGLRSTAPGSDRMQLSFPRLDPRRVAEVLAETRAEARRVGIVMRTPDMPDDEVVKYYDGRMDTRDYRCDAIWSIVGVAYNGDVYICPWSKEGNVREKSLREIRNIPVHRQWRRFAAAGLPDACAGCCCLAHDGQKKCAEPRVSPATLEGANARELLATTCSDSALATATSGTDGEHTRRVP
jgi:MoaA/NifB/PqqE/SkfB family radical SAM enzyme